MSDYYKYDHDHFKSDLYPRSINPLTTGIKQGDTVYLRNGEILTYSRDALSEIMLKASKTLYHDNTHYLRLLDSNKHFRYVLPRGVCLWQESRVESFLSGDTRVRYVPTGDFIDENTHAHISQLQFRYLTRGLKPITKEHTP